MNSITERKTIEKVDYSIEEFAHGEYEDCTFVGCNFSNVDLRGNSFVRCKFKNCNLSLTKVIKTGFSEASFENCKLLGVRFDGCNEFLFSVSFTSCILNLSSFYKLKLQKTKFSECSLHEVDFSDCNLSESVFDHCDLTHAVFRNTILENADLRTSYNYSIDPDGNKIRKAKFSLSGITGLLEKYGIEVY